MPEYLVELLDALQAKLYLFSGSSSNKYLLSRLAGRLGNLKKQIILSV